MRSKVIKRLAWKKMKNRWKSWLFIFHFFWGWWDRPNFLRPQGGEIRPLNLSMTPPNFSLCILLPLDELTFIRAFKSYFNVVIFQKINLINLGRAGGPPQFFTTPRRWVTHVWPMDDPYWFLILYQIAFDTFWFPQLFVKIDSCWCEN